MSGSRISMKALIGGVLLSAVIAAPAFAQQNFDSVQIKADELADGIYMLTGAGGNIGVSAGEDGVFLIDDQFAPLTDKIVAAVKEISDEPIRFVLNTHWHQDHTGGNENLGNMGVTIVAHDNVRAVLSKDQFLAAFNRQVTAAPAIALPKITFNDTATFHLNEQTIRVTHLPNAHTGGDSFVQFVEADIIHTGDTFFNGFYPFIDVQNGGSVDGMIAAADTILEIAGPDTVIIPGHGPVSDRDGLMAFRDMLKAVRANVAAAMDGGKSVEDVVAAKPTSVTDAKWGNGFLKPDRFTQIVYSDLAR